MSRFLFTSESVTEGHPDKVCDAISDAIVDHLLSQDKESHVACETLATKGLVVVSGEIRSNGNVDVEGIVKDTLVKIGYTDEAYGMDSANVEVKAILHEQSLEIAQGVDAENMSEQGAGDQGIMFGYACTETPELMPAPVMFAHRLNRKMADIRKSGGAPWMRPDCKSQVAVDYEGDQVTNIVNVVISTQHAADVTHAEIESFCIDEVVKKVLPKELISNAQFLINPTGRFVVGGPQGDAGLTGRKIIVDTYGGSGRHGGGAFSGKDPSKVDRSAAYMCRWVAKNIVAAGLASRVELQVGYAIGHPQPTSVTVETFGTNTVGEEAIENALREVFSFKPADIISQMDLLRPIYRSTTNYGHFAKDGLPWEDTGKAEALKAAASG